ncbi:MAG: glycosyltransferase [Bryobacteraceae bacterium]|nr:glycosyltransferase [Bryobacteraceae bacterium]
MLKPSSATALVIAPEPPWPVAGGGALRTASLLTYLQSRYKVHLITWQESGKPDVTAQIPPDVETDVLHLRPHSKDHPSRLARNLIRYLRDVPPLTDRFGQHHREIAELTAGRTYDLVVIEHFWCAGYSALLRSRARHLVLNLHNVESVLLERSAGAEGFPASTFLSKWAERSRELERELLPDFDTVLTTSETDAGYLPAGVGTVLVYPNTIPYVDVPSVHRRSNELVFSGNFEYHPNLVGARWFIHEVWPTLKALCPELTCRFVGRNEHAIRSLLGSDPRFSASGPVGSAVDVLAESTVAIVPLLSGSGTRLKILEAWAAQLPVVSTSIGAEGLNATEGEHLVLANNADEFVSAVVQVLHDEALRDNLGRAGRSLYERQLTWNTAWNILERAGF